ncbi:Mitochondrial NADH kinase [Komagataella phaffii CBS 7435]|uniref:Mitochondrial NADH kinase, phosphorylates NADH n=2 Tax=Komagataella phaffii TaxID=460519 RepID=C4QXI0_KOMPG|nr:Mitochondrial NADH kinase, phosphorylates NADH [Komagataella phaffii GS115]AOA61588.1 GQ67_02062T0 [Komagataella phaffii]CAH2446767.1 Mitochondrial NADH kinase [Komagataella phaffii CBS 7435]AOA66268.1 GQ68_02077T0 [Komagataella phaffii GS115]CAY67953.1 Mitochondrial NADH kinase, phosphorylates NADH [Komagataella phaffii GS115]CCA37027.1 Mitochondrial NADH kinase [Komagataella phaffii CBS 7435]
MLHVQRWSGFIRLQSRNYSSQYVKILPVSQLAPRQHPEYISSPHSKLHNMIWTRPLRNVLVVKKPQQGHVLDAMVGLINHIHQELPSCNIILTEDIVKEIQDKLEDDSKSGSSMTHSLFTGSMADITTKTDLIVSLGGDGTILRAVSMFSNTIVPPILSYSLGTLGFLLPFNFNNFKESFNKVYTSRAKVLHRTRLECHIVKKNNELPINTEGGQPKGSNYSEFPTKVHAMNDIVLHRGSIPTLTTLDIFIDGEFLTRTTADGISFSTPTGSTAYSLSAGGSIVHPLVKCILLTPICPRSLSFRPLVIPATSHIIVRVVAKDVSRECSVKLSIDGVPQVGLSQDDEIHVVSETGTIYLPDTKLPPVLESHRVGQHISDHHDSKIAKVTNKGIDKTHKSGIWCVAKSENDWTTGINNLLGFNSSFRGFGKP